MVLFRLDEEKKGSQMFCTLKTTGKSMELPKIVTFFARHCTSTINGLGSSEAYFAKEVNS